MDTDNPQYDQVDYKSLKSLDKQSSDDDKSKDNDNTSMASSSRMNQQFRGFLFGHVLKK